METTVFRLPPEADLKQALLDFCVAQRIDAACVLSGVGSLRCAAIRLAGAPGATHIEQTFEIVSLTGTLSRHGCHLHISLADAAGQVVGGHLMDGSCIHTTAEIVLGIVPGVVFMREHDPLTGYRELVIKST